MVGVLTNDIKKMKEFYRDVLGFKVMTELDEYVEFKNEGVRFALSTGSVMQKATGQDSFLEKKSGHVLSFAFRVDSAEEVDTAYTDIIEKGAVPIKPAEDMPWNQRTAFFADPDGNIHEIFADLN